LQWLRECVRRGHPYGRRAQIDRRRWRGAESRRAL
jgi:hypothetical protein